jgi:hypothetical protein
MIWLTWRQSRTQAAVLFGAIVVILAALAATGPHLAHMYQTRGPGFLEGIGDLETNLYLFTVLVLLALPALIGMFWGAPLVTRELDAGTHRLVWTMTTRVRWLVAKLGLMGLAAMTASGLLSLAVTWWAGPIDAAIAAKNGAPGPGFLVFPRMSVEIFGSRGSAPIGYAALFFVLGVVVGVLVRRTLPAMAIVLALFIVTQIAMFTQVRSHLITPRHLTTAITAHNLTSLNMFNHLTVTVDRPGAWIISQQTVDAAGKPVTVPAWVANCLGSGPKSQECFGKLTELGYRQQVTYHPADRFWALQLSETLTYVGLALALAGLCIWWIHRRLS